MDGPGEGPTGMDRPPSPKEDGRTRRRAEGNGSTPPSPKGSNLCQPRPLAWVDKPNKNRNYLDNVTFEKTATHFRRRGYVNWLSFNRESEAPRFESEGTWACWSVG
jgi:hypothetical protein